MSKPGWDGAPDMDIIFYYGVMFRVLLINVVLLFVTAVGLNFGKKHEETRSTTGHLRTTAEEPHRRPSDSALPGEGIVADGHKRLLDDPEIQQQIDVAVQKIREKYQKEWAAAGCFRKLALRFRIQREIKTVVEQLAPSEGLYFTDRLVDCKFKKVTEQTSEP